MCCLSPLCQQRQGQRGFKLSGTGVGGPGRLEGGVQGLGFAQRSLRISPGNSVRRCRATDGFGDNAVQRSRKWWPRKSLAARGR